MFGGLFPGRGSRGEGIVLLYDRAELLPNLERVQALPQCWTRNDSPINGAFLECINDDACFLFWHPVGVGMYANYFQQEFFHFSKEWVWDVLYLIGLLGG